MERKSDRELLADYVAQGSQAAFAEIVRRHAPAVYATCFRVLNDAHDAEDAAQAVFLILARKAQEISRRATPAGWLHQVAEHAARNARRVRARRVRHEREAAAMRKGAEHSARWEELRPKLDGAVEALPRRLRDPLTLRYFYGRSETEIAAELNCPRTTVASRLSAGLTRLRAKLKRRDAGLSVALLASLLRENAALVAPENLTASIQAACLDKAGASATAWEIGEATMKAMWWRRMYRGVGLSAAGVLLCVLGLLVARPWAGAAETGTTSGAGKQKPVATAEKSNGGNAATKGTEKEAGKPNAVEQNNFLMYFPRETVALGRFANGRQMWEKFQNTALGKTVLLPEIAALRDKLIAEMPADAKAEVLKWTQRFSGQAAAGLWLKKDKTGATDFDAAAVVEITDANPEAVLSEIVEKGGLKESGRLRGLKVFSLKRAANTWSFCAGRI